MKFFFRIRAFVDSNKEEQVCIGSSPDDAMSAFSKTKAPDTGCCFGSYGIDVAMIHKITFGETCPAFEDVTAKLSDRWARSSFDDAMSFYTKTT